MSGVCAPVDAGAAVVPSLAAYVECQAQALGRAGFSSFAGSAIPNELLTACLALFVGLIGLRLLAGETYSLADATRAALRVGLVMVFSLSWPAYQTVFYDVAIQTPRALANGLLSPLGLRAGTVEETAGAFQNVYDAVNRAAADRPAGIAATGILVAGAPAVVAPPPTANGQRAATATSNLGLTPDGRSGLFLMVSSLGALLAMRLAAGLLLALGPLVIVFCLFDSLTGLFVGWIRALIGVTLAALSSTVVAALELDFLQSVVVPRATTQASAFVDPGLLVTSVIFTLMTLGACWSAFMLARGFHLRPRSHRAASDFVPLPAVLQERNRQVAGVAVPEQPSRARVIVDSIRRGGDQNGQPTVMGGRMVTAASTDRSASAASREVSWIAPQGIDQVARRGLRSGKTMSAARRDKRT